MPYIEVLNGPEVGKKTAISQDTFFLGRDANNHLVLSDRTVSRKHVVINHLEGQYIVSDLNSLKGLLVNGVKKQEAVLEDGDEIAIGAVRLRFYGKEMGKRDLGPETWDPKKKKSLRRIGFVFLFIALCAGGFYLWQGHRINPKNSPDTKIQEHYARGISLFNNEHDTEGAKEEWEKVLELDPHQATLYGQKAAKLLENIR